MNITFLIGNGFDVGVGMKSKFKDFFPLYVINSLNKEKRIKQLSENIDNNYETWADFETALGTYTLKFNSKTKKDFIDQVKDFSNEFMSYLNAMEQNLNYDSSNISKVIYKALMEYYSMDILPKDSSVAIANTYKRYAGEGRVYNFINFNYTSVLSNCLQTISNGVLVKRKYGGTELTDKIGTIHHIHGKRDLYPIIGVNDVSQISNEELAKDKRFVKYIVKPEINKLLRLGNNSIAENIISTSSVVCVYGMSLGQTDKKWWEFLLSWLYNEEKRQLVIFAFDKDFTTENQFSWLEKEDDIIDLLSSYNKNDRINVENLRNRIHIAVHKNIFEMDLMKEFRETTELALEMLTDKVSNENSELITV